MKEGEGYPVRQFFLLLIPNRNNRDSPHTQFKCNFRKQTEVRRQFKYAIILHFINAWASFHSQVINLIQSAPFLPSIFSFRSCRIQLGRWLKLIMRIIFF